MFFILFIDKFSAKRSYRILMTFLETSGVVWTKFSTLKAGKNWKKVKTATSKMEFRNDIFHESAPEQDKRDARKSICQNKGQKCGMLKG